MRLGVLALLLIPFGGCGSDPAAPKLTISGLTYAPMSVTAQAQTNISGSFAFSDPDGDAAQIGIDIALPDGTTQTLQPLVVANIAGQKMSSLTFTLAIRPPTAGSYTVHVWLIDALGQTSNKLAGTVQAN